MERRPIEELKAEKQRIYHASSGRSIAYNHLLLEANKIKPLPEIGESGPSSRSRKSSASSARAMPFNDAKDMVTGKAVYGADVKLRRRGMLTAVIERCPVANGAVKSFDAIAALAVPGVKYVTPVLPPGFLGGHRRRGQRLRPPRGRRRRGGKHLGGVAGPPEARQIEWDLSSTAAPNARYDSDDLSQLSQDLDQQAARRSGAKATRRRSRRLPGRRESGLPRSSPGPGTDGAARGHRPL